MVLHGIAWWLSVQCPTGRVSQCRVRTGIEKNTGLRVGFVLSRGVELYDQVFSGTFFFSCIYWISFLFLEVVSQILSFFLRTNHYPRLLWCYTQQCLRKPETSSNARYFGLPATHWISKLNRVRYLKKYRTAGLVRVPVGHWLCPFMSQCGHEMCWVSAFVQNGTSGGWLDTRLTTL